MTSNYAVPIGPTMGPQSMVNSVSFFDDFIGSGVSASAEVTTWEDIGTATTTVTNVHSEAEANGAIAITSGAAAGNDGGIQLNGEPIKFDRTADMAFECRFKLSSVATNVAAMFVGLAITNQDIGTLAAITSAHVGFTTDAANDPNRLLASSADGTTQTESDTSTDIAADTYVIGRWVYRAQAGRITFYINGSSVAVHDLKASSPANMPNDDYLTIHLGLERQGGSGATLTVDYVAFVGDRTN